MNFDFSDDQKLLQHTVRDYLADNSPLSVCREILETEKPYADDLWKGAAEMGWQGAVIPEEYGGAGFGHLELAVIAEEVGRALAPIPFSSSVYFATEAILRFGSDERSLGDGAFGGAAVELTTACDLPQIDVLDLLEQLAVVTLADLARAGQKLLGCQLV